jgi:hypothetical protein
MMDEHPLTGGYLAGVTREGDTVRRALGSWTPAVHALLHYLDEQGFQAVPRVLGVDDGRREVLTFIPGDTVGEPPWPAWVWDDRVLVETGALLADYHRVVRGFRPSVGARWRHTTGAPQPGEVVCHNDVGPQNMVFRDGSIVALIDWDWAQPAIPAWDLAHAAWLGVPLFSLDACRRHGVTLTVDDQARRLDLLCASYGLEHTAGFVDLIVARVRASIEWITTAERRGDDGLRPLERSLDDMRSTIAHIEGHKRQLASAW